MSCDKCHMADFTLPHMSPVGIMFVTAVHESWKKKKVFFYFYEQILLNESYLCLEHSAPTQVQHYCI